MKRHRRVEITAFQRKITIVSGEFQAYGVNPSNADPCPPKDSPESVSPDSEEGRRILADAVRLLNDQLIDGRDREPMDEPDDHLLNDRN